MQQWHKHHTHPSEQMLWSCNVTWSSCSCLIAQLSHIACWYCTKQPHQRAFWLTCHTRVLQLGITICNHKLLCFFLQTMCHYVYVMFATQKRVSICAISFDCYNCHVRIMNIKSHFQCKTFNNPRKAQKSRMFILIKHTQLLVAQHTSNVCRSYESNQLHLMKDTSELHVLHSGRTV